MGRTYDPAGNRTAKTNKLNNITEQYTYDPIYQLTKVVQGATTTESYSYDPVGNRLSSQGMGSYSYNTSNELTATLASTFTYDNNGNTLTKTDSTGTRNYAWDFENRLAQAVVPGVGTVTFRYDPFGRRIQKSGPNGTINYVYDGANSIAEVDSAGNLRGRYAYGAGIDEALTNMRSTTSEFYEQDGLASVTSLSSSTAALTNSYMYDTFGNLATSSGTFVNPYQYTGRDFDSETGLRYYRARYYDAQVGKFIAEDPIRFRGGANFYNYVRNNPPSFKDAYGLHEQCTLVAEHQLSPWIETAKIISTTPWGYKDFTEIDDLGIAVVRCRWERKVTKELWGSALFALEYHCVDDNPCDHLRREHTFYHFAVRHRLEGQRQDTDWTGDSYSMFVVDNGDIFYEALCRKEDPPDE